MTPDTVVAILTILGYSLYDTVVVFDRVRDNTRGLGSSGRMTYSEMVNLSMNQTLARSINTSLVAIMPVFAVLVIGAEVLGAITLQNYGLALFVGLMSGAYSSIFIASPILAILKEREHRYTAIRQRLAARTDRAGRAHAGRCGPARGRRQRPGPLRRRRTLDPQRAAAPGGRSRRARGAGTAAARAAIGRRRRERERRWRGVRPDLVGAGRPPPRPRKGAKRGARSGAEARKPPVRALDRMPERRGPSSSVEEW